MVRSRVERDGVWGEVRRGDNEFLGVDGPEKGFATEIGGIRPLWRHGGLVE
jgi:hypothetical protein